MSVFDKKSRYARHASIVQADDRLGRRVSCLTPALPPRKIELGLHKRREGQRLDHLSARYLDDPAGFWEIAEANDAMTTEAIADIPLIRIPQKG
jgi:hypothetical protein